MGGVGLSRPGRRVLGCIERLGAAQQRALRRGRVAVCVGAGVAWVRVEGVRLALDAPAGLSGIAVVGASALRPATPAEREDFLAALPRVRALVVGRTGAGAPLVWAGDGEPEALLLAPRLQLFEGVLARRDGDDLLFHHLDRAEPPGLPRALRAVLEQREHGTPRRASPRHLAALALARGLLHEADPRLDQGRRLARAVERGGGALLDWTGNGAELTVRWRANGRVLVTRVRRRDLQVLHAGRCVSGQDRAFDLTALCSAVMRQPEQEINEEHTWP